MGRLLAEIARSRWMTLAALATLISLRLLPPEGLAWLPLCMFRRITGLPCPGCGLTRSLIALAHGDVAGAARMHPGGFVLFFFLLAAALLAFAGSQRRQALAAWIEARGRAADLAGLLAGGLVVVYGVGRLAWPAWSGRPSIW